VRRLKVRKVARAEIAAAFDWYLIRSPAAADQFLDAVDEAIALIFWRARARDAVGQGDSALADYGYVARLWRRADPVLQPYVQEAERAIARLSTRP